MLIKATVSFSGSLCMAKGDVRECSDKAVLSDLLDAGYVVEVKEEKPKKAVNKDESK